MAEIELFLIVIAGIGFDILIGDPEYLIHPVQVIGCYVKKISNWFIRNFSKNPTILFWGGFFISITSVSFCYLICKFIEIQFITSQGDLIFGSIIFFGLSSCLATRSLISSVKEISFLIEKKYHKNSYQLIQSKVQKIVSRDVSSSSKEDLLRSATESLTENSVDGIFAPLFWIFIGTISIKYSMFLPGPLSLGFSYKAISTLDSMIGYKNAEFKYLGFFGAKMEDCATYLPARLVALTLPLVSNRKINYFEILTKVFKDGRKYESPNSGISEGIFAYIVNLRLGGTNLYADKLIHKPYINVNGNNCDHKSIILISTLIYRLILLWMLVFSSISFIL